MKKLLASLLLVTWLVSPAEARVKSKVKAKKSVPGVCYAATCTDHSYDEAYSARRGANRAQTAASKPCMFATCTDHSKDEAYSANWADKAKSPDPNVNFNRTSNTEEIRRLEARNQYYSLRDFTVYGRFTMSGMSHPNPYMGDNAPSYDGAARNAYRNMRANNESEPLPASDGKK